MSFVGTSSVFFFFFNDTATTEIYTLSLHDALPISGRSPLPQAGADEDVVGRALALEAQGAQGVGDPLDALALQRVARRAAAEDQRRDEEPQLVDLAGVEER